MWDVLEEAVCHEGSAPRCEDPSQSLSSLVPSKVAASLQPTLQQVSPFQWPLLSMFSSFRSNIPARKSGTQSLFRNRPKHTR